jgi:maltooligosyltrehalose trehalohydrolase
MPDSAVVSSATPADPPPRPRRLPIGAEYLGNERTDVRIWAPAAQRVEVIVNSVAVTALAREADGYFSGVIAATTGDGYQFRIDGDEKRYPDPASRFQPDGPHGPSQIVDPAAFTWSDAAWRGVRIEGQVVYELHVGTFTPAGTWDAAVEQLGELARIGITIIEVMPIAEFGGRFGWGYDGVDLYAPTRLYGSPDDFRRFVDTAHGLGLAVVLDVVYNHFGPVGNYLRAFAPAYFSDRYENEWGDALNFDGPDAGPVREFFIANAGYWIDEFHLDGLRLDATQQIFDQSDEHVVAAIGRRAREAAGGRSVILIAENEPQDTRLIRSLDEGGYGLDALWNDDFHHAAMVALTGRSEAYYSDTCGQPQEFVSAAKYGYLFQGQHYHWQRQSRGTPSWGARPAAFVSYLQNHDQVANSATGFRGHLLSSPGRWRAMTALTLLMPSTPMLFQGQEFGASAPFLYFADHDPDLAKAVRQGRAEFLRQFPSIHDFLRRGEIADPADPHTFAACKLDFTERESHAGLYALHQDLLKLRRDDDAFRAQRPGGVDGSVLAPTAFALRFFTPDHAGDRLLIVNLGRDFSARSIADPLVAPPLDTDWAVRWSSEDPGYGGLGTPDVWAGGGWFLPGESAIVFAPGPKREPRAKPKLRRTA